MARNDRNAASTEFGFTALIGFGGGFVSINGNGPKSLRMSRLVFGTAQMRAIPRVEPAHYTLERKENLHTVYRGEKIRYKGFEAGNAAETLMDGVLYDLAAKCRSGLVFHAACICRRNKAILLPGKSGAGKSSLAAWLTSRGFDYSTDEMAFIPLSSVLLEGMNRAMHLKRPFAPELDKPINDYLVSHRQDKHYFESKRGLLLPASALNSGSDYRIAPMRLIVFPEYRPAARSSLEKLSPAQSAFLLMGSLINARNLEEHGLSEIFRLANNVEAYKLVYGKMTRLEDSILKILDASPSLKA